MTVFKKLNQGYRTSKSGLAVEVIGGDVVGKLFILSVEEDDLETAEKIMAFIESTELVMCTDLPSAPLCATRLCVSTLRAVKCFGRANS